LTGIIVGRTGRLTDISTHPLFVASFIEALTYSADKYCNLDTFIS
jgi:hypothetical protein